MDTIRTILNRLPLPGNLKELPTPPYVSSCNKKHKAALAVESMRHHTTNEGWQLMLGLQGSGYSLWGHNIPSPQHPRGCTHVPTILSQYVTEGINTLVMQDKREWDMKPSDFRDPQAHFHHVGHLADRSDIFKLTVLKDAHQRQDYHQESATEIGCHAWIIYYHPAIIQHLSPFTRQRHLIRTYHTIDPREVPPFIPHGRLGSILSGAVGPAYPLRKLLISKAELLPELTVVPHPGYHRNGSDTPNYLRTLSYYKVAICTTSIYGYSLRKIIEATACGCKVLTNLPSDDVLPIIDSNLTRISSNASMGEIKATLQQMYSTWDADLQMQRALHCMQYYDYYVSGVRLSHDIEYLRKGYNSWYT